MSVEIAWKQNILVTDSYLLKLLLVVFGFGLQAFVCDFSRQNICSVLLEVIVGFQLLDLIIPELKSHVIPYKFKCSHWWKFYL